MEVPPVRDSDDEMSSGCQSVSQLQSAQSSTDEPSTEVVATNVQAKRIWTFIDQSTDLDAVAEKRITDKDKRNVIRSHVMKGVRQEETEKGIKRPAGRNSAQKKVAPTTRADSNPPETIASASVSVSVSILASASLVRRGNQLCSPVSDRLDPFFPCSGSTAHDNRVDEVTRYCFASFLPMTFPNEKTGGAQIHRRKQHIIHTRDHNPPAFLGMMGTVTAQRAIVSGNHLDLRPFSRTHDDFIRDDRFRYFKGAAIAATCKQVSDPDHNQADLVESICSLISTASMIGDFVEARTHLVAIKGLVECNPDLADLKSPISNYIVLIDVKAAVGMKSRPYFRLPWQTQLVPNDLLNRLMPEGNLRNLGASIMSLGGLSIHMIELLQIAVHICWYCEFNHNSGEQLSPEDHLIFERKTLELEYRLLSYIYQGSPDAPDQQFNDRVKSPFEEMIRLVMLGMMSRVCTKALPAGGLGRALTTYQLEAMQKFLSSHLIWDLEPSEQYCLAWISLQAAQGATGQVEEEFFTQILGQVCVLRELDDWNKVATLGSGFLFVPGVQELAWKKIWKNAMSGLGSTS